MISWVYQQALLISFPTETSNYLKKLYLNVNKDEENMDLKYMQNKGFTVREIEILTGISKSQVSRELKDDFE